MKQLFYIPKEGVQVRNHDGRGHVPAEGAFRMQNQYYDRRVKDGDLMIREAEEASKPQVAADSAADEKKGKGNK